MFFAIPAAMAAIGAGVDIYGAIQGSKQAKQAEADLKKFVAERDKLQFTDQMQSLQVGQRGEDLASANLAQQGAQALGMIQEAGAAAAIGGVGQIMQAQQEQNLQLAAGLSERAYMNDLRKAMNAQMVSDQNVGMKAANIQQDIMGAQSAYAQGMEQKWAGLSSAAQGAMGIANMALGNQDLFGGAGEAITEKAAIANANSNLTQAQPFTSQPFGLTAQNFGAPGLPNTLSNEYLNNTRAANAYYMQQQAPFYNPFFIEYGTIKKP
jgi:hypothetical protein